MMKTALFKLSESAAKTFGRQITPLKKFLEIILELKLFRRKIDFLLNTFDVLSSQLRHPNKIGELIQIVSHGIKSSKKKKKNLTF